MFTPSKKRFYVLKNGTGRDISILFPPEQEVLVRKNVQFKVLAVTKGKRGSLVGGSGYKDVPVTVVDLEQISGGL